MCKKKQRGNIQLGFNDSKLHFRPNKNLSSFVNDDDLSFSQDIRENLIQIYIGYIFKLLEH